MLTFAGTLLFGYLAGAGVVTNGSILARGLKRSVELAINGNIREAGSNLLVAVTAPAVISVAAVAALVCDVISSASAIAGPALNGIPDEA